jgi:hypothetical protein
MFCPAAAAPRDEVDIVTTPARSVLVKLFVAAGSTKQARFFTHNNSITLRQLQRTFKADKYLTCYECPPWWIVLDGPLSFPSTVKIVYLAVASADDEALEEWHNMETEGLHIIA